MTLHYSFFYLTLFGLVSLLCLVLFHLRHRLPSRFQHYLPVSTTDPSSTGGRGFRDAAGQGLTSSLFDLEENISSEDQRKLDSEEVAKIMREEGIGFDEARLIRQKRYMARNGVDASGMPLDKKAITSLS